MITVICDTKEEKSRAIEIFNRSDLCPFGDKPCKFNYACLDCISQRIKFIMKENKDE